MTQNKAISDTASMLNRAEAAVLVAAERGNVTVSQAEYFGASVGVLDSLVTAGLLKKAETHWLATEQGRVCAEILCPKCYSLMSPGKALIGPPPGITYEGEWPVKFRDCLKCHSCGHSEQERKETLL